MFEIHITTTAVQEKDISDFIAFCKSIEAKPIIIELSNGETAQQPMISKVVKSDQAEDIHLWIDKLCKQFEAANYPVKRVKVEVPLEYMYLGESAFPDYKGKYFEWHGKFIFDDEEILNKVKRFASVSGAHLSNNSLKGEPNTRFLTIRNFHHAQVFKNAVDELKRRPYIQATKMVKEEYEYCIYDSNKTLDKGWIDTPQITDHYYLQLLGMEAFLRRASTLNEPFVLKGSLLTRQYIEDKSIRNVQDIDYVYNIPISETQVAKDTFKAWVEEVINIDLDDGVVFSGLDQYELWNDIDYGMHDDFPTANTDIYGKVYGQKVVLSLDISWNLPISDSAIPINYIPALGDPFEVLLSVPLALQISWKLHQTIVRTRTKDLVDIILLIENNDINEDLRKVIYDNLCAECEKDHISPKRLLAFEEGKFSKFYQNMPPLDKGHQSYSGSSTPFGFRIDGGFHLKSIHPKIVDRFKNMTTLIEYFEGLLKVIALSEFMHLSTSSPPPTVAPIIPQKLKKNFWQRLWDNLN